jgi:hypothetical protein
MKFLSRGKQELQWQLKGNTSSNESAHPAIIQELRCMSAAIDLGRKIQYIYLHDYLPSLGNELRIIISKRYPVKNS